MAHARDAAIPSARSPAIEEALAASAWPLVSVVIPARNEQSYIRGCVNSLLAQDYPGSLEILVVDGDSSDGTAEIVGACAARDSRIRLLHNPWRDCARGLNLGIRKAVGEIIVRADAHCVFPRHYVRACAGPLLAGEAENVGGLQWGRGEAPWGEAVAAAMRSRFGAGDAAYRYSRKRRYVDTVFLGAWRKSYLESVGGFCEDCLVNQDSELNCRIRRRGDRILLAPEVKVAYFPRNSLGRLFRQYLRYGFWKVHTLLLHPWSVRWRQLVAPTFVAALIAGLVALPWTRWGLVVPLAYLGANLGASAIAARNDGWRILPRLPGIFAIIHVSWGAGFLAGLVVWPLRRPWRRQESLLAAEAAPPAAGTG